MAGNCKTCGNGNKKIQKILASKSTTLKTATVYHDGKIYKAKIR